MEERLKRIQRIQEQLALEVNAFMESLFANSLDAATILSFAQRIGVDFSSGSASVLDRQALLDPYKILGLEKSCTEEAVKQRYRELLKRIHPDTSGVKGTEYLTQLVTEAYRQIAMERRWH